MDVAVVVLVLVLVLALLLLLLLALVVLLCSPLVLPLVLLLVLLLVLRLVLVLVLVLLVLRLVLWLISRGVVPSRPFHRSDRFIESSGYEAKGDMVRPKTGRQLFFGFRLVASALALGSFASSRVFLLKGTWWMVSKPGYSPLSWSSPCK